MDMFILLTISLVPLSTSTVVQSCPWRMKSMIRNGSLLVRVPKPAVVRSAMHCVHLCISTRRCDAVQFTMSSCTMYSVEGQSVSDTKLSSVFYVKKAIWPQKFISKLRSQRKEYRTSNLRKTKTSSTTNEEVESTVSAEMKSVIGSPPISTTQPVSSHAENSSPPQRIRNITKALCLKHEGFTYMPKVSMCVIYVKGSSGITWMEARHRCSDKGGDLVLMKSSEEYSAIQKYLIKHGVSGFLSGATFRSGIWIGLQIHPNGGRWTDNSRLTYMDYLEKSVKTTHCVALISVYSTMGKRKCSHRERSFLCEVTS